MQGPVSSSKNLSNFPPLIRVFSSLHSFSDPNKTSLKLFIHLILQPPYFFKITIVLPFYNPFFKILSGA